MRAITIDAISRATVAGTTYSFRVLEAKLNRPSALRDARVFHFASLAQPRSSKRLMYHCETG